MTRNKLVKIIAEETGYEKEEVANILESFEYKILDCIATEENLQFAFGTFSGITKDPKKITGFYADFQKVKDLEGWCQAKIGYPQFKFSKEALYCLKIRPREFFESPENRYTTLARTFRKDVGIPEIEEYKGLPEEKIEELCKQADVQKYGEISKQRQSYLERHQRWNKKFKITKEQLQAEVLIREDLQKQRDAGVAEEELVHHTYDEILAIKEQERKIKDEQFKKDNADWLRKKAEIRIRRGKLGQRARDKQAAKREDKFAQLRKENLGEDYLEELDD